VRRDFRGLPRQAFLGALPRDSRSNQPDDDRHSEKGGDGDEGETEDAHRRSYLTVFGITLFHGPASISGEGLTMRAMLPARTAILLTVALLAPSAASAQRTRPAPLATADVDAIVQLVKLEDTRTFDEAVLTPLVNAAHPEVRRRAIVAVGRIADRRGRALLVSLRGQTNAEIFATVAFSTGQLKDVDAIPWLSDLLSGAKTPPAAAFEAARALGKIRAPADAAAQARAALVKFLSAAPATNGSAAAVGEALRAIGRFPPGPDLAPIVRWTTSSNVEVRWRAAWALFRPRDPAAVPPLLRLSRDKSPEVRFWAVRGLSPAAVDAANVDRAAASARLRAAVKDADRRVRTEALRALAAYDDDESFAVVLAALESSDSWLSVSAAEAMARFASRKDVVVPKLIAAVAPAKPRALRITALTALAALAPDAAKEAATALAQDSSTVAKGTATQVLARLAGPRPPQTPGGGTRPPRTPPPPRGDDEYRAIVERSIVPDYNGAPKPRVVFETPRGTIEIEVNVGDAPLGADYLRRVVESGEIVGTEFGRVVPNFVAQQRPIRDSGTLRDEVNRRGLLRGTLSWASAGLDTGRPGYTLGNTPQPHNEGDFTALGRVVRGMEAVDRLELGDKITGARFVVR
jgi:HEAT repeat protein